MGMKMFSFRGARVAPLAAVLSLAVSSMVLSTTSHASGSQQTTSQQTSEALERVAEANQQSADVQARINALDDSTRDAYEQTRQTLARADQVALYNEQLAAIIADQERELESLALQIDTIDSTEQGILPLMRRMVDQLQADIDAGSPFLINERLARVARLDAMLSRADVSVSEKFRRILETLQIEVDYGRTVERYRERDNGVAYDYLRIGRVALYRSALDGDDSQIWQAGNWVALDSSSAKGLEAARRIADETSAPALMMLPLATRKEVQP
ncbi:MAG: hypothetical protein CMK92_03410 [Pseudomonas sp.]|nr:hypothetical protein [Pseudomonas sp.]